MEKKFKWYKRLHALLSASPVHDHSGLANSTSPINLDILSWGDKAEVADDDVNEQRTDMVCI